MADTDDIALVEFAEPSVGGAAVVSRLTWEGHDFLDAIQDDTIWAKPKESVLKPTLSASLDVLLEWLKRQAKVKM